MAPRLPPSPPTRGLATALRVAFVVCLVAGALAPVATASPRPVPACGPCDRSLTGAARAHGVDATVERSTATMRVHENGSATWTVADRLNAAAAERLGRNDSLRRAVATDAVAVHDARLLSARVDGDTLRLRYRTPNVATETPGGVLRVDYFRDDPGARVVSGLGADRLTLVAPEGRVVGTALPGAEASGRRMTVTAFRSHGDGPFVTLVPEGSALAPVWSLVAVAVAVAPVVGRNLLLLVALPSLLFAGCLAALSWGVGRAVDGRTLDAERGGLAVAGLGVVLLAHPLYAGGVSILGSTEPVLLAGAAGLVALGGALAVPAVRRDLSTPRLVGLVALAFGVAVAVGYALRALPVADRTFFAGAWVVGQVLPALPVYAAVVAGDAAARGELRRGLLVAVGAFALATLGTFSIASHGGTLYGLAVALVLAGAVVGTLAGTPLFVLGYALPSSDGSPGRD
ncbi:MAG: hypothetical protein ABEJ82_02945 [Haloplanus sp.]